MKKICIILCSLIILVNSDNSVAAEISENEIVGYFKQSDIAITSKDYKKYTKLISEQYSYYVYYPTVTPPDDERVLYDDYLRDIKEYFDSDVSIKLYQTEIIQIRHIMSQAFVSVRIKSTVHHGDNVNDCYIPAFYFLKKENNKLVATKFDGVAECYQQ